MTIQAFHAKNYGCLRDVQVVLGTRLHAFVGPNDSGKSTLLRGIQAVLECARTGEFRASYGGRKHEPTILQCHAIGGSYEIELDGEHRRASQFVTRGDPPRRIVRDAVHVPDAVDDAATLSILDQLRGARLCQLAASALRAPSGLVPQSDVVGFIDERGSGLPGIYQAILGRGDDAFAAIRESVRVLFPTVKRVAVVPVTRSEVSLEIELVDGTHVRASEMSAGLLYYLAFAAIPHLAPVSALLLEGPENGLHPARIAEVMRLLRNFAELTDTQVFFATHSPLVLNDLAADEISVVTRPPLETGTVVTPLRATPNFEQRAKVYALGELWLAYCDGETESPLLDANVT